MDDEIKVGDFVYLKQDHKGVYLVTRILTSQWMCIGNLDEVDYRLCHEYKVKKKYFVKFDIEKFYGANILKIHHEENYFFDILTGKKTPTDSEPDYNPFKDLLRGIVGNGYLDLDENGNYKFNHSDSTAHGGKPLYGLPVNQGCVTSAVD